MHEELVNQIKAELEALFIEVRELRKEVNELKKEKELDFDISEIDPMDLLDSIDEAAEGKVNTILSEAFTRWKKQINETKTTSFYPKAWTKEYGIK
jgi:ribosome recycling factor